MFLTFPFIDLAIALRMPGQGSMSDIGILRQLRQSHLSISRPANFVDRKELWL